MPETPTSFRLPKAQLDQLEVLHQHHGVTKVFVLRTLLAAYFAGEIALDKLPKLPEAVAPRRAR